MKAVVLEERGRDNAQHHSQHGRANKLAGGLEDTFSQAGLHLTVDEVSGQQTVHECEQEDAQAGIDGHDREQRFYRGALRVVFTNDRDGGGRRCTGRQNTQDQRERPDLVYGPGHRREPKRQKDKHDSEKHLEDGDEKDSPQGVVQAAVGEVSTGGHGDKADSEGRKRLEQAHDLDLPEDGHGHEHAGDDVAGDARHAYPRCGPAPRVARYQYDAEDQ